MAVRVLLAVLACLPFGQAAPEGCPTDGDGEDVSCLMQGGVLHKAAKGHGASSSTCFQAHLGVDPSAVPVNAESLPSHGFAYITVTADSVMARLTWHIPFVSLENPVIGMHIHEGNSHENGGILVGFCGTDPLPPFSGNCSQGVGVLEYQVNGMACDIRGSGSPCVHTSGRATIEEAARELMQSTNPSRSYYLNIHTMYSFNKTMNVQGGALGLIRGQLHKTPCRHR